MTDKRRLAVRRDRGTRAVDTLTASLSVGAVVVTGTLTAGMSTPVAQSKPRRQPAH